jgi:hypothetical protein
MRTFAEKPKGTQPTKSANSSSLGRAHVGQGHDLNSTLHLQRTIGNQAVLRLLQNNTEQRNAELIGTASPYLGRDFARVPVTPPKAGAIQTKLAISAPGDEYEQEADRVAVQVMHMPEPQMRLAGACAGESPKWQTEKGSQGRQDLQTKHVESGVLGLTEAPPSVLEVLRSPGRTLDPATRAFMEPRFGYDFSRIQVHSDAAAQQSARDMNARAYTVGQNIVFGCGQLAPGTHEGQQLLAHELAHTLQQSGGAPVRVARQPMDPRHARGFGGEQGMGFIHYRQEDGWIFFEGPSGSAGHGVTEPGFDGIAYNVRTGETHLVDNKSLARQGNVGSATAIDPSGNLGKNLDGLIQRVEAAKDVPGRVRLLGRLRALKASLVAGKPLPQDVKLVVTGVGGQSTGVTGRLQSEGVEFRSEPAPKSQPAATAPAKPPTTTPAAPTVKPPTAPSPTAAPVQEPPVSVTPPVATPKPAPPLVPVQEPPIAVPGAKPPVATGAAPAPAPVPEAPSVAPLVRPTSAWKTGLKAGGKALVVMLAFAGLDYLVRRGLEKDLEASLEEARKGSMPWAQRLKREDASKPVYVSFTIQSEDYSNFVPLLGWMPEAPKLHMISMAMVRAEIDPPIVDVKDRRLDVWHPGVTTTVTYTELMVP